VSFGFLFVSFDFELALLGLELFECRMFLLYLKIDSIAPFFRRNHILLKTKNFLVLGLRHRE